MEQNYYKKRIFNFCLMKKNHIIIIPMLFLSMFTFSVGETLTQNNSLFLKNSPIFSLKKFLLIQN